MEYIAMALLAIIIIVVVVAFIMAFCKLSGDLTSEEERLYTHLYVGLDDNRCVCCGEVIPEGRQVCKRCEDAE